MCACGATGPGPTYSGRYGFQWTAPDPSCPTCRVGAFASGDPLPPMPFGQQNVIQPLPAGYPAFPSPYSVRYPIPPSPYSTNAYVWPNMFVGVRKIR